MANLVKGLNNITFTAHSQGTLITGNALLNLGFTDNRNAVTKFVNFSSPLSQPRAAISAAIGGTGSNRFIYANNWGDPVNLVGPNINPAKFISGATFQFQNH